jgi:hypothetical protein
MPSGELVDGTNLISRTWFVIISIKFFIIFLIYNTLNVLDL